MKVTAYPLKYLYSYLIFIFLNILFAFFLPIDDFAAVNWGFLYGETNKGFLILLNMIKIVLFYVRKICRRTRI